MCCLCSFLFLFLFSLHFRKVIFLYCYFYYPSILSPGTVEQLRKYRKMPKWGCSSIQHYCCLKITTMDGDRNNFHQQCLKWKIIHYKSSRWRKFVKIITYWGGQCYRKKQRVMFKWKNIATATVKRSGKQKDVNVSVQWVLVLWMSSCPEGPLFVQEHNYCHRRMKVKEKSLDPLFFYHLTSCFYYFTKTKYKSIGKGINDTYCIWGVMVSLSSSHNVESPEKSQ